MHNGDYGVAGGDEAGGVGADQGGVGYEVGVGGPGAVHGAEGGEMDFVAGDAEGSGYFGVGAGGVPTPMD